MRVSISQWSARGAAAFCVAFALFQAALALGAPFGQIAWGGSSAVLPTTLRWTSAGAAVYEAALTGRRVTWPVAAGGNPLA